MTKSFFLRKDAMAQRNTEGLAAFLKFKISTGVNLEFESGMLKFAPRINYGNDQYDRTGRERIS